jgi:glycerol-3-phosphate cytidylyltransferase-like family protein
MQRILVFGTFDGVHDGHRAMLREARVVTRAASEDASSVSTDTRTINSPAHLTVAVAPDSVVATLKGVPPRHTQAQRLQMIKNEHLADEVILGDLEIDSWRILKKVKPTCIGLGYDQEQLRASLEAYLEKAYPEIETDEGWQTNPKKPKIVVLSPHKPDTHHNRILRS